MSKRLKNYPDPNEILERFGADALRAYMIDSPVVRAEELRFDEAGLKEIVRTVVLPYWNVLSFFSTYASLDGYDPSGRRVSALVTKIEEGRVTLDRNHPMAGRSIRFEATVAGVREATPEELQHGHVHGPGGHHH